MTILSIILYVLGALLLIGSFGTLGKGNQFIHGHKQSYFKEFSGMLIAAVIFIGLGWVSWPDGKSDNKSKVEIADDDMKSQGSMAYVMSQEFVKKLLKAPATADFPLGSDPYTTYMGDSTFIIKGYVDAQNSFGANLRSNYYAKMKFIGNDQWQCLDVRLLEE